MQLCLCCIFCIQCSYYCTDKCFSNIVCQLQFGETALHVARNVEIIDYVVGIGLNIEARNKVLLLTLLLLTCSYCFKLFRMATHRFSWHVVMVIYL